MRKLLGNPYMRMGKMLKPVLVKWAPNMSFRSSHFIKNATPARAMLPLRHYKFAPNFASKVKFALEMKSHNNGSKGYAELEEIYKNMTENDASFICKESRRYGGYHDFESAGIAMNIPKA